MWAEHTLRMGRGIGNTQALSLKGSFSNSIFSIPLFDKIIRIWAPALKDKFKTFRISSLPMLDKADSGMVIMETTRAYSAISITSFRRLMLVIGPDMAIKATFQIKRSITEQ